jgi:hypothetical protein
MSDDDLDEPYENTFSLEDLRKEVRRCWDLEHAIIKALRDIPEQPPQRVQKFLGRAARWIEDFNLGKQEQHRLGSEVVWYKTEIEGGAGLWARIRDCLREARKEPIQPSE